MRGIKKLHHLIQALSKTEKRYISIELSKQKSKKGKIDLLLFNLLKKQETLDEDKTNSVPEFNSTLKLIIRSKYLFEFILRCLIDYNHSREIEIAIGNHIRIIKIFILKGLHEYTHQHLNIAQKLAEKYEDLYRQGVLCTLRKIVINRSSSSHVEYFKEIQKIENLENSVHNKIINLNTYNYHLNHLSVVLKKNAGSRLDNETQNVIKEIAASHFFTDEKSAFTKKAKIVFHEVNSILQELVHHNYRKSLLHTEKQMNLIREMESYEKAYSPAYINCLKYYCVFASEAGQFSKAKEALDELGKLYQERSLTNNLFEKSLIFLNYFEAETHLTVIDHNFLRFENSKKRMSEEADLYEKMYNTESKMVIYLNLSIRFLLMNDYKNAFRWLEKIIHENLGMRLDILEDAHIFSLICIFEIDSVNLFQSRERSYLRHYVIQPTKKENNLFAKNMQAHIQIVGSLAKIYKNKNVTEQAIKILKELEFIVETEAANKSINSLLGQTILLWARKKINVC
jgi:hypothetical protein